MSIAPNPFATMAIATAIDSGGSVSVRHVLGTAFANGWRSARKTEAERDRLRLEGDDGSSTRVPFDGSLLR